VVEFDGVGVCYGSEVGRFYRTFRFGDLVYIVQRCTNSDGRILELSKYGLGGQRSFIAILEGQDGRGGVTMLTRWGRWSNFSTSCYCWEQAREDLWRFSVVVEVGGEWSTVVCGGLSRERHE
jgi:hypothetical protein